MLEDHALQDGNVSGEGLAGEVVGYPTTKVLVILTKHVDKVRLPKKLLAERVGDEVECIGTDVGEDLVAKFSIADEDNKPPDYIVGRDA